MRPTHKDLLTCAAVVFAAGGVLLVDTPSAAVPATTVAWDDAARAAVIDAPIARVMVFSDRARVTRHGTVSVGSGVNKLRFPDLPGAVMPESIQLSAKGAKVIRVETQWVERSRSSIPQVESKLDELEKVRDEIARQRQRQAVLDRELAMWARMRPVTSPPPVPDKDKKSEPPRMRIKSWKSIFDFVEERERSLRAQRFDIDKEVRGLDRKRQQLERDLQAFDLGAFREHHYQVMAVVQRSGSGRATLELEYVVPGASWKPVYEVRYDPAKQTVDLQSGGLVQQATGEDWKDVDLRLSTAIPGRGIEMPELLTWVLGEKSEYIPTPRPIRSPQRPPPLPPPSPQPSEEEVAYQARIGHLRQRYASLTASVATKSDRANSYRAKRKAPSASRATTYDFADDKIEGDLAEPEAEMVVGRSQRPSSGASGRMAAPSAPMAAPMAADESMEISAPRRSRSSSFSSSATSRGGFSLALFEPAFYSAPHFPDPLLPAVLAGGFDYVFVVPTPAFVASTGEVHRVPLRNERFPAQIVYRATPSLQDKAYASAVVTNRSAQPILAGVTNIFVDRDFVGQGKLETTGPGDTLNLPLGVNENIRIKRTLVLDSGKKGVFNKKEFTWYRGRIEVVNHGKAIELWVHDQLPKTRNKEISIELGEVQPKASTGPDEDGVISWKVTIPRGGKRVINFAFKIEHPKGWRLYQ